jgi:hypothetical protein
MNPIGWKFRFFIRTRPPFRGPSIAKQLEKSAKGWFSLPKDRKMSGKFFVLAGQDVDKSAK